MSETANWESVAPAQGSDYTADVSEHVFERPGVEPAFLSMFDFVAEFVPEHRGPCTHVAGHQRGSGANRPNVAPCSRSQSEYALSRDGS